MADDSDTYRLLRTGGTRSSTSMQGRGRSSRYKTDSSATLPPNINDFGHRPFKQRELGVLAERLQARDWPQGSLNIVGLEGLLTAVLVLDTGLHPSIWMSLIWNETGWKLPIPLRDSESFNEFTELMCGFLRALDAGFRIAPPQFDSVIDKDLPGSQRHVDSSIHAWATGFVRPFSRSHRTPTLESPIALRALRIVASFAQTPQPQPPAFARQRLLLGHAVEALAAERTSCGPLGVLPSDSN